MFSLVCLFLGGHSHHDTRQDGIMHVCFGFVVLVFLLGTCYTGLRTGPLPALFVANRQVDSRDNYNSSFLLRLERV